MSEITPTILKQHYIFSFSKKSPVYAIQAYKRKMKHLQKHIDNYILDNGSRKVKEKLRLNKICTSSEVISTYNTLDNFCHCTDFMKLSWNTIQLVLKFKETI